MVRSVWIFGTGRVIDRRIYRDKHIQSGFSSQHSSDIGIERLSLSGFFALTTVGGALDINRHAIIAQGYAGAD